MTEDFKQEFKWEEFKQEFKFADGQEVAFESWGVTGHGIVRGYASMGAFPQVIVETVPGSMGDFMIPSEVYPYRHITVNESHVWPVWPK